METDLEVPAHFCLYGYQEQNTLVYFKCLHFEIKSGHETKRCVKILALTYPPGPGERCSVAIYKWYCQGKNQLCVFIRSFSGVGSSILSDVAVPDGFIFKARSEIIVYVVSFLLLKAYLRF